MNNNLHYTGLSLDDQGDRDLGIPPMAKDISLDLDFIKVLAGGGIDRQEAGDDTYGTPPDGPFSERASAVLRDNHTPRYEDGSPIPDEPIS